MMSPSSNDLTGLKLEDVAVGGLHDSPGNRNGVDGLNVVLCAMQHEGLLAVKSGGCETAPQWRECRRLQDDAADSEVIWLPQHNDGVQ